MITLLISSTLLLSGCCLKHDFAEASCTQPQTCTKCGETEGEPLEHIWVEATCTEPKQCSVCNLTEGEPLGHTLSEATCIEASKCEVCNIVEGEPLGHNFKEADYENPKTCVVCGLTEGEPLPEEETTNEEMSELEKEAEALGTTPEALAEAKKLMEQWAAEDAQKNNTQVDVDYPGMTPGDPSQDGQIVIGDNPALAGDYIN